MKIRKLFLRAYGPFTESTLDFSGAADLHVIYGANEAGKSSALRAITDLRNGIPPRSRDDFVHEFKDMLLAGCFEDAVGRAHGLARRKGNKDTLMGADPTTGVPQAGAQLSAIAPEVLQALTGGVAREQFETMYGLDSNHLRKGGQQLIQGEGDMGAALFEASTGSAGIKQLLQTLQLDARKYFIAKGQLPILNESVRQLEDARQRYKLAVIRPEQWKALNRVHEGARSRLADVRNDLAAERRRLSELTELRAVEPLLRELDLAERLCALAQGARPLPADARERRLAALARQVKAREALAEADAAIAQGQHSFEALKIEPLLIAHATAIDRLETDFSLVRREQAGRLMLQAAVGHESGQLALRAQRITRATNQSVDDIDQFFSRTPSSAGHAELENLLASAHSRTAELQFATSQLAKAERKLGELRREVIDEPAPELEQALALALKEALLLGDASVRLQALQADIDAIQRKLGQSLGDLGLAGFEQLASPCWLAAGKIDAYEQERGDLLKMTALSQSDVARLQSDLMVQKRRLKALAAIGEVVTADTLRHARGAREQGWQAVRAAFIEREATTDLSGLPTEFERLQADADRQADLLREGARRAAEIAECEQRIGEMTLALSALVGAKDEYGQSLAALDSRWNQTLSRLGIPPGRAATVREWQGLRQGALERGERLAQTRQAHSVLERQISNAKNALHVALTASGPMPADLHRLDALIALGTAAEREMAAARMAAQRRRADIAGLELEAKADEVRASALVEQLQACRRELDGRCGPLGLEPGAPTDTIKTRLAELRSWVNDYQAYVSQRKQLEQLQAGEAAAAQAAVALGRLLTEPVWEHPDAWLDALARRLATSREAAAKKDALQRAAAEENRRRERAASELREAADEIDALVAQAGVENAGGLPEAEALSDRRREASARLEDLNRQLARTSQKDFVMLRQQIDGLDSLALDAEKQACQARIAALEADEKLAIEGEQVARAALAQVDTSDEAARAREEMESAIARYRAGVRPWAQLKLAESLLAEALRRHREKAQGPVVALAGEYFRLMTGGRFARLLIDDDGDAPLLLAQPAHGKPIGVSALSEGTADQLYLALRLAALELQRRPDRMMPLVLDDVLMTADDERAGQMFRALEKFASGTQVLVFTHHHHLLEIASKAVAKHSLRTHRLDSPPERAP